MLRVLLSIPTRSHVGIAIDELTGLQDLGFVCDRFSYTSRENRRSLPGRLWVIFHNAFLLIRKSRQFRPDIIYFNSRLEVIAGLRDCITVFLFHAVYSRKVKFVIKSHGSDLEVLNSRAFLTSKLVLPYLRKHISGWLFLSGEERDKVMAGNYFLPGRIFQTKNIVRTDQFRSNPLFREKFRIPDDHKILLFTGRVIREKGIFEVVEAFHQLTKLVKATLIIVGDGSEFVQLKEVINGYNLSDQIILTGFIPEPEVVEFYANSDVLVFPTYFPEGFPMALFNSVGAGMAVITTATRAATDFLSEPENCLWVEPKNSESVFLALMKLLTSTDLMDSMKQANRSAAKLFTRQKVSSNLAVILEIIHGQLPTQLQNEQTVKKLHRI